MFETILYVAGFLCLLSILVIIHELGHFLTAKKFGIKVEEFGIGFPPRAWSTKKGETVYSINWLPIGGFVKLYGEDDAGGGSIKVKGDKESVNIKDEDRAFYARPLWQRMTVVVSGVVMNFILAITLITIVFATNGYPIPGNVQIAAISDNSPAKTSGLLSKDEIIKVNEKTIKTVEEFSGEIRKNAGKNTTILVVRGGQEVSINLIPRSNPPKGQGAIGVEIAQKVEVRKYTWFEAPFYGTIEAGKFSLQILQGLGMIVTTLVKGNVPEGVGGPVAVAQVGTEVIKNGIIPTLWFAGVLSLNLAVMNILPIPALDGGRFFFQMIEFVFRKKVSPKNEALAHGIGLVILLGLMLLITVFDIGRIASGQSLIPK